MSHLQFFRLVIRAACTSPVALCALAFGGGLIIGEILRYTIGTP